jgi:hypothetical protein
MNKILKALAYAGVILLPSLLLGLAQAQVGNKDGVANMQLYRATCAAVDTTDQTTYTFSSQSTGISDAVKALIVVGISSEDTATAYGIASATIDGTAAIVVADENGGLIANNFGLSAFIQTPEPQTGANSVDVSVTFTEAISAAQVCVWAIANVTSTIPIFSNFATAGAGAAMTATQDFNATSLQQREQVVALGMCMTTANASSHTWTGLLTERDDSGAAELTYSNADFIGNSSATITATCDPVGFNDTMAVVAYGTYPSHIRVTPIGVIRGSSALIVPDAVTTAGCQHDFAATTTYTFTDIHLPGIKSTDEVLVVVGIMGEDATVFGVNSATIDAVAATEIVDEDGTGVVNTAFYTSNGFITGANEVTVAVTWSEAIGGAAVCVWAIKNLTSATPTSSVVDDDTSSGALALTLGTTTLGGVALAVCLASGAATTATWAEAQELVDVDAGTSDFNWSAAAAWTTGASMSVTCDLTGTDDASGAAVAFY